MRYADTSAYMDLCPAVKLLIDHGTTEADAREFVKEALDDPRRPLAYRHDPPPAGARAEGLNLQQEIDWPTSVVTVLVRYGARFGPKNEVLEWCGLLVAWQTRIEVCREDLLALIALARRSQPRKSGGQDGASPAAARRGRKPHGATREGEILREFDRMVEAGEVSFEYGGLAEAVRKLLVTFPGYGHSGVEKIIRNMYNQHKRERSSSSK